MSERQPPQSFSLTAGESVPLDFTADGDITGATARFWMSRWPWGSPIVLTTEDPPPTNATASVASPQFTISITDENTEDLVGTYVYEVELEDVGGNKTKAAWGFLTFSRQLQDLSTT